MFFYYPTSFEISFDYNSYLFYFKNQEINIKINIISALLTFESKVTILKIYLYKVFILFKIICFFIAIKL